MKRLTGTWGLAVSAVRALLIVARTVTDAKIAVGVGTMTDNPLSNPDSAGQTDWIEDLSGIESAPERIRVIVRPGKDDWIGVAYSSSVEPNDVIREYVRPTEPLGDYVTLLERNNGRLREVLKEALEQTGCDGDLCSYRWHEKARVLLGE